MECWLSVFSGEGIAINRLVGALKSTPVDCILEPRHSLDALICECDMMLMVCRVRRIAV